MKATKKFGLMLTIILLLAIISSPVFAETYGGGVLLKGTFIEVGISGAGYFGTSAPSGYHNNAGSLGFVADYQRDGWTSGTPNYGGDYFTPGTAYEGFGVAWTNGSQRIYSNSGDVSNQIPALSITETSTASLLSAVWVGEVSNGSEKLKVIQTTSFKPEDLYFVMNIQLINTGTITLNSVKYERGVDPDNEQPWVGSYNTNNNVTYQPGVAGNVDRALVTATGQTYSAMLLGLGTIDSRARVSAQTAGFAINPDEVLNTPVTSASGDNAIGLAYNFGSLAPGQSVSFDLAYILSVDDLSTALGNLAAVTIVGPTGTISGTAVPFLVTTDDVPNTSNVDFYVNGVLIGSDTTASGDTFETTFNSTSYPNGTLNIRAVATISGVTYEKTSTVTVDNSGPAISFVSPISGTTVSGDNLPVSISHDALNPPTSVAFYRESGGDTVSLGTDTSAPFGTTFNTSDLAAGASIVIRAVATNSVGATSNITVGVVKASSVAPSSFSSANPPDGTFGSPYSYTFVANGIPAPTYSVVGTLPSGLSLNPDTGVLSGTPSLAGTYSNIVVRATNSAGSFDSATFDIVINKASSSVGLDANVNPSVFGQSVSFIATVSSSTGSPTGTVSFYDNGGLIGSSSISSGTATFSTSALTVGSHTMTANYSGDTNFNASSSGNYSQVVNKANSSTTIISDAPDPSVFGQDYTVSVVISAVAPGTGTPGGTVTISDGVISCDNVALVDGAASCVLRSTNVVLQRTITATYSGNGNFNASTDSEFHRIDKADSVTNITSDVPDPSVFGQDYTVSVLVSAVAPGAGIPGGTVTISDGVISCNNVALVDGAASCDLPSTDVVLQRTITATYSGNGNFNASSDTEFHRIDKADSTTTITSDVPDSSVYWQDYTVSFQVAAQLPGQGIPSGTVLVSDGDNSCGPVTLVTGAGSCTLPSTSAGIKTLTATYSGNTLFNPSSDTETHEVRKALTEIELATPYNPAYFGAPLQITASVVAEEDSPAVPVGAVQFYVNDATHGSPVDLVDGSATSGLLPETLGTYEVYAEYLGTDNYVGITSAAFDQVVEKAPTSTVVTSSLNPSVYGQNVMFSATVVADSPSLAVPNGTIQFKLDGVNYGAPVALNASGVATRTIPFTALWPDVHHVTAVYSGATNFLASNNLSTPFVQTVLKANPVITITPEDNPIVSGQPTSLEIKVAGSPVYIGIPTGTVTLLLDGNPIAGPLVLGLDGTITVPNFSSNSGSHEFTVQYSGDDYFDVTAAVLTDPVTINKANSATVINGFDPIALVVGQPTNVTVTVSAVLPGVGVPTGSVLISNGTDSCTANLDSGSANCLLTPTVPGNPQLSAVYAGDVDFNSSTADLLDGPTVIKADTSISSLTYDPTSLVVGQPTLVSVFVEIDAPGSGVATGEVTISNGHDNCVITLVDGAGSCELTPTSVGQPDLSAEYSGDSNFNDSLATISGPLVEKADTQIQVFTMNPGEVVVGQPSTFSISVNVLEPGAGVPTGEVTVTNGEDECIVTLVAGAGSCDLTPTMPGSQLIYMSYAGDDNFNASTGGIDGLEVEKADTSISEFSYEPSELVVGQPTTVSVVVTVDEPGSGVPSGTVLISNGVDTCEVTLIAGAGSCVITPTAPGSPDLSANYSGDSNFNASTNTVSGPEVAKAASSISTFTFDPTNLVVGQPTTVQIAISIDEPGSGVPTGNVTISNGIDSCVVTLVDGSGSCELTPTSAGQPDLTAEYPGDDNFEGDLLQLSGPEVIPADTMFSIIEYLPNVLVVGQSTEIYFTVSAAAHGSGTPTGSVIVSNGTENCEATLVGGSGTCTFTPTTPGQPDLTASYSGDSNFNPVEFSFEGPLVSKAETSVDVTSSDEESVYGQSVIFTAQVSVDLPGAGSTSGSVQFYLDGVAFGEPVTLVAGEGQSDAISNLDLGAHSVYAQYSGDDYFNPSTSATTSQTVIAADTMTELISTRNPAPYGDSVLVIATVTALDPSLAIPTGFVQFKVNGVNYGAPIALNSEGKAEKVLPYTALWVGTHEVTAVFLGSPRFNGSDNLLNPLMQVIDLADTEIHVTPSIDPSVFGQSVSFEVVVDPTMENFLIPTGTVQIAIDNIDLGSELTLDGTGTAVSIAIDSLSVGTHDIQITYSGDEQYAPNTAEFTAGHEVARADTTTEIEGFDTDNLIVGQETIVNVSVDAVSPGAGIPGGTVTVSNGTDECLVALVAGEGSCSLQITQAGQFDLVSTYHGDENFNESTSEAFSGPTVSAADTDITSFTFDPSEVVVGQPFTVNVFVETIAPGVGIPTGKVTVSNGTDSCEADLDVTGAGSCELTPSVAGQYDLEATYPGDGNFNGSTETATPGPLVNKATANVKEVIFEPENPVTGQLMTVSVELGVDWPGSGIPGGTIDLWINGILCTATVVDGIGTCEFIAPASGIIDVDIDYPGDSNFLGFIALDYMGPDVLAADSVVVISGPSNSQSGRLVSWTATVSAEEPGSGTPTGNVQFYIDGNEFGSEVALVDGQAVSQETSTLTEGVHEITAQYFGDSDFNGSTSYVWTFLINAYRYWFPIIYK